MKVIKIIEDTNMNLNIIIGNKSFSVSFENNDTSKKFINMMPLELGMKELNNIEKYYYLNSNLPTNEYNFQKINTGDIMLFGNNCLVIFYKSFNTSINKFILVYLFFSFCYNEKKVMRK